jgi:hypothetical protein
MKNYVGLMIAVFQTDGGGGTPFKLADAWIWLARLMNLGA